MTNTRSVICFGIDFGTTFSGVAWAWSGQPNEIYVVTSWPSKLYGNSDREKTPSELYFKSADSRCVTWGYDVPTNVEPLRWFKLLLVEEDQLQPHLKGSNQLAEARQKLCDLDVQPVEVIATYLRQLWVHALDHVRMTVRDGMKECRFHIVVTIPAIWKDAARQRMVEAVKLAGLLDRDVPECGETTLDLLSEPEAGAIATFSVMEGRPDIQEGDAIIVVDAGGGTVDLISYKVDSVSPLTLSECAEGTGGLCGAVFLDQDFERYISKQLAGVWGQMTRSDLKKMVNDCWEHGIKQEFDGDDREFTVTLPYSCASKLKQPDITLKSGHIVEIFDNVVTQVEFLVGQQLRAVKKRLGKPPKYVILVGGFGRCRYLRVSLENLVEPGVTKVIQGTGPSPWTAICRGAVLQGLITGGSLTKSPVRVSSRVSRANYGMRLWVRFVEGEHLEEDRVWCPYTLAYKAQGQMQWYLLRGDETSDLEPRKCSYHRYYDADDPPESFPDTYLTLYTSADQPARSRYAESSTTKALCTIKFRYPLQFSDIPVQTNAQGRRYRRIDFYLRMRTAGSSVNFEVYTNNKSLGRMTQSCLGWRTIEVEYEEPSLGEIAVAGSATNRPLKFGPQLRRSRVNLGALIGCENPSPFSTPQVTENEHPSPSPSTSRRSVLYQMPSAFDGWPLKEESKN